MADILKIKTDDGWQGIAVVQGDVTPIQPDWEQDDNGELDYIKNKPEKLSDFTDDTSSNPVDQADTLTGLSASVSELNYCDGVSSNIQTQINGKADKDLSNATPTSSFKTALNTAGIRTVVETYSSGGSWYRVYSDGWCEQGGYLAHSGSVEHTNTLLKPYADDTYTIVTSIITGDTMHEAQARGIGIISKTASTFKDYGWNRTWVAFGYIS